MLPLLAEEAWEHGRISVPLDAWPVHAATWRDDALAAEAAPLLELRAASNAVLEQARMQK